MAALSSFPAAPVCRTIKRTLLDTRWHSKLPFRSITTASHSMNAGPVPEPLRARAHPIPEKDLPTTTTAQGPRRRRLPIPRKKYIGPPPAPQPDNNNPRSAPTKPETQHLDESLDASVRELLPMLHAQPPYFIQTLIHEKPYLVTAGDTIRLPFYMHGVSTGDVLRLNRATLLGSRDYTLKAGAPKEGSKHGWIDERLYVCKARVMGTELEPMRIMEKTKRRRRHVQHIRSKHRYTVLKVMEVTVKDPELGLESEEARLEEEVLKTLQESAQDLALERGESRTTVDDLAKVVKEIKI